MDGRIHPAKIEELAEKAKENVAKLLKKRRGGRLRSYVFNLGPADYFNSGTPALRTSYGQNVLQHSVEMAHLAGMLAEELGADPRGRAGALLHDIGKAVDHEVQGTHVELVNEF